MLSSKDNIEHEAVTNFRKYLRIPTVHPNVDYSKYKFFLFVYLLVKILILYIKIYFIIIINFSCYIFFEKIFSKL